MKLYCIEKGLRSIFFRYGSLVAKYPLPFVVIPIVVSIILGLGIVVSFTRISDPETLYGPRRTQSRQNRVVIEDLYQDVVDENMLTRHQVRIGYLGQVILTTRSGDNVLTVPAMKDVLRLHDTIMNVSIQIDDNRYRFADLCIMWHGGCLENDLLSLLNYSADHVETTMLTYPVTYGTYGRIFFIGSQIGGVTLNGNSNELANASALQLAYNLRYDTQEEEERGLLWEEQFLRDVEDFETDELNVDRYISQSIDQELVKSSGISFAQVAIVGAVISVFSVLTMSMFDWVKTKPILACLGVLTAGLALVSTFGLLSYAGVPYITMVGSMPFLIMGIGVDDMFIIVSAWRRTGTHLSTETRVKKSLEEAALSITITSLTDILAFSIGAISKFYCITIFCLYATLAVLFSYIYMITFFAGCLVISGHREEKNRHAITLQKVCPKADAPTKAYYFCCAGGSRYNSETQESDHKNASDTALMVFVKTKYGPFLTHKVTTFVTVLLYFVYIAIAIWGFLNLKEGLIMSNVPTDDSYLTTYFESEKQFFRVYGPDMSVVVKEQLRYWKPEVQAGIENVMMELETSKYFYDSSLTVSWLRSYLQFLNQTGITHYSKHSFSKILQEEFLTLPRYQKFIPDIIFDAVNESIVSSRCYVIGKDIATTTKQRDMFLKIRQVLKDSPYDLVAFHRSAPWHLEGFLSIRENLILTLSIGIAAMFVISIVLIPHPVCAVINTASVISTVFGLLGYMAICNITLDYISMVTIIISLGFSVDYSAHTCYAFVSAQSNSRRQRSIYALYSLGIPTLQGAVSTFLAVCVLATSSSYIFRTFFQTMCLVITIGTAHGMIFLPVFLMLLVPIKDRYVEVPQIPNQLQVMKSY